MAKTIQQLQIAHRIHQVLVREIDHAIEVERLLTDAHYARDVLLVCDALAGSEAPPLATQFRLMPLPMPMPMPAAAAARDPVGAPGHAQQPTEGSRDLSGFNVTQPPPVAPVADPRPRAASPPASPSAGRPAGRPDHHRNWLARWRVSR